MMKISDEIKMEVILRVHRDIGRANALQENYDIATEDDKRGMLEMITEDLQGLFSVFMKSEISHMIDSMANEGGGIENLMSGLANKLQNIVGKDMVVNVKHPDEDEDHDCENCAAKYACPGSPYYKGNDDGSDIVANVVDIHRGDN